MVDAQNSEALSRETGYTYTYIKTAWAGTLFTHLLVESFYFFFITITAQCPQITDNRQGVF